MNALGFLIPISIALGALGLAVFFWAVKSGQYEDVAGAARRIFIDENDKPL
ncbi:MAG: cbb3-type cytochrome oxidase assembly protein CcoS [Sphingomonadaceae bacterium]